MKNLTVGEGLFVEIEYVLTESGPDGEVLEECPAEQAFGFRMGGGDVLPAFEAALIGKKQGEPFSFTIPCAEAYGEKNPQDAVALQIQGYARLKARDQKKALNAFRRAYTKDSNLLSAPSYFSPRLPTLPASSGP